jgi:hypothetical protein
MVNGWGALSVWYRVDAIEVSTPLSVRRWTSGEPGAATTDPDQRPRETIARSVLKRCMVSIAGRKGPLRLALLMQRRNR